MQGTEVSQIRRQHLTSTAVILPWILRG